MPLKQLFAPHLNRTVKMGRKRAVARGPRLFLKNYLKLRELPSPPQNADYSRAARPVLSNVYLNDQLGDCVIAGGYHVVGVETGNADDLFTATDQQITGDYSAIGGYVRRDPNTDNGCDEATALNYWTERGFADGTKLLGWLAVDPTDRQEVAAALYLFENLFFGIELPDAWVNPMPSGSGFTWDAAGPSDPANGHCVAGVGYNPNGVTIDTWGLLGTLTWNAIAQYCTAANNGELYVMLTPDQLKKGQSKAPNGVDWAELIKDFNSIGGHVPVPPPPKPPGPKPPGPKPPGPKPPGPKPPGPKPPGPKPPGPKPMPPTTGTIATTGAAPTTGVAALAWMPPPQPPYPSYPVPPVPPPPPLAEFGQRVVRKLLRSPALGIVSVVGLVVLGVVGVVGLSDGGDERNSDP